ncbi:MAG TPA: glycosyltransferase family 39 protein, partial [Candidatus Binatia bacterium]
MESTDAAITGERSEARFWKPSRSHLPAVFGLIYFSLAFSLISVLAFLQKSPTIDEPIHLFAGYSYLKWGDYRVNPEHPPFAKIWAALPLLAFDLKDPRPSRPHWDLIPEDKYGYPTVDIANDLLFVDGDGETLFFYAKLQMVFLGILLGIFVYLWTRELFGPGAAFFSLLLYGLDPNILAHSQIVHTDVPFTAFFFIATYFFWRALDRPGRLDVVLACVFFALAAITKYSSIAILPVWAMLGVAAIFFNRRASVAAPAGAAPHRADDALRL